jgi:hypothetical protein
VFIVMTVVTVPHEPHDFARWNVVALEPRSKRVAQRVEIDAAVFRVAVSDASSLTILPHSRVHAVSLLETL